jgi:DNA-binding NarL/FixJ family response regulator
MSVVGEASDGVEVLEAVRQLRPDVVLMDVRMPELDGIEATRRLVAQGFDGRILMLTTFDLDDYVFEAMRAGAAGFLLKTVPPHQLISAIRDSAAGDTLIAPTITRRLVEAFVQQPRPSRDAPSGLDGLTPRELEVLRLVARGMSNAEVATELYLGESTVKTHVARVLMKLGLRDRVQAVVVAYECGLVRPGGERNQ